jgi:hypothetical protein
VWRASISTSSHTRADPARSQARHERLHAIAHALEADEDRIGSLLQNRPDGLEML